MSSAENCTQSAIKTLRYGFHEKLFAHTRFAVLFYYGNKITPKLLTGCAIFLFLFFFFFFFFFFFSFVFSFLFCFVFFLFFFILFYFIFLFYFILFYEYFGHRH